MVICANSVTLVPCTPAIPVARLKDAMSDIGHTSSWPILSCVPSACRQIRSSKGSLGLG